MEHELFGYTLTLEVGTTVPLTALDREVILELVTNYIEQLPTEQPLEASTVPALEILYSRLEETL